MKILRIVSLTALILLANCAPVQSPREHAIGGPEFFGTRDALYTSAMQYSLRNRGIAATLSERPVPREALKAIELDLQSYAQKNRVRLGHDDNFYTLTFKTDWMIGGNPEALIPRAWEDLAELAEILNRQPSLLVIIHGHAPFSLNEHTTLQAGLVDATKVSRALESAGGIAIERLARFGCDEGDPGTLSITLAPREIARYY